jgi:polar amino acid transport system permease protein
VGAGSFNLDHMQFLVRGAAWTIGLSLIAFVGGGVLGFLVALCRVSGLRSVRFATATYVMFIQGTPLLVLMFLMYFGVAMAGIELSPLLAAALALTIYSSAYLGEIWRGCIESVPRTQWEAAECLPLTRTQRMRLVVLPQAFRIATPPTVGFMVQIVKNSSLAAVVGFVELTRAGQLVNNSIFDPFTVFMSVALLYFGLCYSLSRWSRRFEANLGRHAPVRAES